MRRAYACTCLLVAAACSSGKPGAPAAAEPPAATAARPSVDDCKRALDRVIEVALVAFDDDVEFREEIMASVRASGPREMEARCHAEATVKQVACLTAVADVDAVRVCAEPVAKCTESEPPDQLACEAMEREWAWAAELITGVFAM